MQRSASLTRGLVHVADWVAFAGAGLVAYLWRFSADEWPMHAMYAQLLFGASWMMLLSTSLVYKFWGGGNLLAVLGRVGMSWVITWGVVMTWLVLTQTGEFYSRLWLGWWAVLSLLMAWGARVLIYLMLLSMRALGISELKVLLVGEGESVATMRRRVKESTWTGYKVVGVAVATHPKALEAALQKLKPDEVWIFNAPTDTERIQSVLQLLKYSTANIRLIPDLQMMQFLNQGVTVVLGIPMLDISSSPMAGLSLLIKWLEDKILSAVIIVLISPILLLIGLAVKVTSKGPVIFRQSRHGWNGEEIRIFKFRSMYVSDEDARVKVTQARKGDPRITPLGQWLRATSLDELPQFFNVLLGSMSIVGPRPHAVAHNMQYRELIPRYMLRHKVKPGITGWAQVNGFRGETDTVEKMELRVRADLYYIENWSLWLDIKIIIMTIFKGFINKNAY